MQIGNFTFEFRRTTQGLELHVNNSRKHGIMDLVTDNDLAKIGHWFTPSAPPTDNGIDRTVVEQIISAGIRSLAKAMHPDTETGSTEEMAKLNNTADQIRERLRR